MSGPGFEKRLRDFLASEDLDASINMFLDRHAQSVVRDMTPDGEFSMEIYALWKEYLGIIEDDMEKFRVEEGLSDVEFKRAVEDVASRQPFMVKLMIASWEFEQFVELCKVLSNNDYVCIGALRSISIIIGVCREP